MYNVSPRITVNNATSFKKDSIGITDCYNMPICSVAKYLYDLNIG